MISEVLNSTPLAGTVLMQCHWGNEWLIGRAGVLVGLHYQYSVCPAGNCQQYQCEPGQARRCDPTAVLRNITGHMGALRFHMEGWPSRRDDIVKWAYSWSAPCVVPVEFPIQCSGTECTDLTAHSLRGEEPEGTSDHSVIGQTHMKSAID